MFRRIPKFCFRIVKSCEGISCNLLEQMLSSSGRKRKDGKQRLSRKAFMNKQTDCLANLCLEDLASSDEVEEAGERIREALERAAQYPANALLLAGVLFAGAAFIVAQNDRFHR